MLLVVCSGESDQALELIEWWSNHRIGHPVVVLCRDSANGFVREAFAAGADDLVALEPGTDVSPATVRHLGFALHKNDRAQMAADVEARQATMVCVLRPKGGVGKTVTACNAALSLAESRKRVLVDLDLQFGTSRSHWVCGRSGLRTTSLAQVALWTRRRLMTTSSPIRAGCACWQRPSRPDQTGLVTDEFVTDVIATLRAGYDYVIVDTPPSFTPVVITAIDASSYVCIVGMPDALSLKNTKVGLETLELMGYPRDRIKVVLNRANTNVGVSGRDVVSILGREPDVLLSSSRDIARSVNEAEPVVLSQKRSEAARTFNSLAHMLSPYRIGQDHAAQRALRLGEDHHDRGRR